MGLLLVLQLCCQDYPWTGASPIPSPRLDRAAPVVLILGQGLDGWTTDRFIRQGCFEANHTVYGKTPSTARIVGTKVVGAATVWAITKLFERTGNPRAVQIGNALLYGAGGFGAGTAAVSQWRECRR